ncbi:sodium/glutamate symporter [Bacillus sp. FJAT-42315]|uniref:sodium/glutamate symporter n=1 Tax=Bacillus sp. FJAT-42315 TaxID=2014077 RepID=UPI000BA98963|nr:sodium/glutamate symporter [Bacillus sp. FJAT-42315]PAQ15412.1 sodium/glutamate symporter [Bacillaceae bacterium SAOS 7]
MEFNQVTSLFLAVFVFMIGSFLIKKISFFDRFCIPAPVVGGLLFAIIVTVLNKFNIVEITIDTSLQSLFMLAFFTTVGLGASTTLIKIGGKLLLIYWGMCTVLAFMQNAIGISLAKIMNIDPLIGILTGAVSMSGGHGGAAAYGGTIEQLGLSTATTIGLAAATLGLVCGGLVGGPTAGYLMKKYNLKSDDSKMNKLEEPKKEHFVRLSDEKTWMRQMFLVTFCMALGSYFGEWFASATGLTLPGYVGGMIVAVIVRFIIDKVNEDFINMPTVQIIGDISLNIFLAMALMSIKLWEIADLALPMLLIIAVQVVFIMIFSIFIVFRVLGKNYDAAVMISGMLGHGLGATPNAMANMSAVTAKYGPSRNAFLIVPIAGSFLIDIVAMPIILTSIELFK